MFKKEASKAEAKVAAAEKKIGKKKENKPSNPNGNIFVRAGKAIKKFSKDVKGEVKKIVWPDKRSVVKSTGVVLVAVAVCGLAIFGVDQVLSIAVSLLKRAAEKLASSAESAKAVAGAISNFRLG